MSLQQWADNGWLRAHKSSREEMTDLLKIVDRDLREAGHAESPDWRFGIAYNAALKLCTMLLHASGYRAEHTLHHYRTIGALPLILGPEQASNARFLDACRLKRNTVEYQRAGAATADEAAELLKLASELRCVVLAWLGREHTELSPSG